MNGTHSYLLDDRAHDGWLPSSLAHAPGKASTQRPDLRGSGFANVAISEVIGQGRRCVAYAVRSGNRDLILKRYHPRAAAKHAHRCGGSLAQYECERNAAFRGVPELVPYVAAPIGFSSSARAELFLQERVFGEPLIPFLRACSATCRDRLLAELRMILEYAHQAGLFDLDLHPSNIIVNREPDGTARPSTFVVKVKNAQDAGAIGVIIADNVAGSPPAGLAGVDPTITISSGRVTLADGNTLKANLAAGVNVTLGLDLSILAGTDRIKKLMLLATFDPVALGSSISHFDGVAFPNQLMEPAINPDLTASVTPPEDLTTSLFTDLGWLSDQDGVPDGTDSCIGSDLRETVFIENCNTKTNNVLFESGCSISDRLLSCSTDNVHRPLHNLACVLRLTEGWARARIITRRNQLSILACAVKTLH